MAITEDKRTRILESAIELAEQGGFEAVRLRDVAKHAEVALGTVYKRFRSKDDLLIAALGLESERLERRLSQRVPDGETIPDRVMNFFEMATRMASASPAPCRSAASAWSRLDFDTTWRRAMPADPAVA